MNCSLRRLGLALALTLTALAASSATAHGDEFLCAEAPCIATGTSETTTTHDKFTVAGVTVECHGSFEATQPEKDSAFATITPYYSFCTDGESINPNHCAYIVWADTNVESHGHTTIECAEGSYIEIHIPNVCILDIGSQQLQGGVSYFNTEDDGVTARTTVKEISFTKTAPPPGETNLCFMISGKAKYESKAVYHCYQDKGSLLSGTERTTPEYDKSEGDAVNCEWKES